MAERRNAELGDFLRTRRSRIDPGRAGLPDTARRRVPGLRREELARLAGMSFDYYTRLEQGRHPTASPAVLDALARALRLAADERSHLYALARALDPGAAGGSPAADDAALRRMFDLFGLAPAVLCGPFSDILAANDAACFLYGADFHAIPAARRNSISWMLLAPEARTLYGESWQDTASDMIGKLRAEAGQHPGDARARQIVAELDRDSALFRRVWRQHEVSSCVQGVTTLHHPVAGLQRFRSEAVTAHSSPGRVFYLLLPEDPQAFEAAYRRTRDAAARTPGTWPSSAS